MKRIAPHHGLQQRVRLLLIAGLLLQGEVMRAQISPGVTALDVRIDPRSAAMGESFIGVPGDVTAPLENPAGLSSISGIRAFYAHRADNWFTQRPDAAYHSAALAFSLPFGTIGLLYNRANAGAFPVFGSTTPEQIGTVENHTNMLAIAFGRTIIGGLSGGVSVKGFDDHYDGKDGDPGLFYESQGCFLLDLGLLYTVPGALDGNQMVDEFTAGVALQNFGTALREQISYEHTTPPPSHEERLPRYLRIGGSYALTILPGDPEALRPARLLCSFEYRNIINPAADQGNKRDYWGLGFEASLYEILSLRTGAYSGGSWTIYGKKGTPAIRYGMGLAVPLVRLGIDLPLTALFDFAAIPLQDLPEFPNLQAKKTLAVYAIGLRYETSAF